MEIFVLWCTSCQNKILKICTANQVFMGHSEAFRSKATIFFKKEMLGRCQENILVGSMLKTPCIRQWVLPYHVQLLDLPFRRRPHYSARICSLKRKLEKLCSDRFDISTTTTFWIFGCHVDLIHINTDYGFYIFFI